VFVNKNVEDWDIRIWAGVAPLVPLPCDAVVYYVLLLLLLLLPWIREISLTQRRWFRK
jgi:hypothetical protein